MKASDIITYLTFVAGAVAQGTNVTTGKLGDAPQILDNPAGKGYVANFTDSDKAKGSVIALSDPLGMGTIFHIRVSGLAKDAGPYAYHIHATAVQQPGNCSSTGAHLDPYQRGQEPVCVADQPQTCEVGDLAGKHGKLATETASKSFVDMYTSLKTDSPAFFGNRSVVLHNAAGDRIACADFKELKAAAAGGSGTGAM